MNVQSEGLGCCSRCGTPIMQAIGQPGKKGVCFGCMADGEEKHGRTVVVTSETGEGLSGKVTLQEVEHVLTPSSKLVDPVATRLAIEAKANAKGVAPMTQATPTQVAQEPAIAGDIVIRLSVDDLASGGVVATLLQAAYDAIDGMPPFKTLRETKRAIKLQEDIEQLLAEQDKESVAVVKATLTQEK